MRLYINDGMAEAMQIATSNGIYQLPGQESQLSEMLNNRPGNL